MISPDTKRARTSVEMRFAAALEPCPSCGTRTLGDLELRGQDNEWSYSGRCPKCGAVRSFSFSTTGDPHEFIPPVFELGPGPTTLLTPGQLLDQLTRASSVIGTQPSALSPEKWHTASDALDVALTCVNELLKLVPSGADVIPGTGDVRLRKEWLKGEQLRLNGLLASYVDDKERNAAVARGGAPLPKGELTRAALLSHKAWLRNGRIGNGRLVLEHSRLAGAKPGAAELTAAKFVDCDLTGGGLAYATLDEAELDNIKLDRADLDGASLQKMHASGGSWTWARMALARFEGAHLSGTDFTKSDLERSAWNDSHVVGATFARVRFGNSTFDRAVFTRCNFRQASFARIQRLPDPTTKETRFEDCDLRATDWKGRDLQGTTFVRCQLADAQGQPARMEGLVVQDCDVTREQLMRQLS